MTTPTLPLLRFKRSKHGHRFSWHCTCRRYETGFRSSQQAIIAADGHCIVAHPNGSTIEYGGLAGAA